MDKLFIYVNGAARGEPGEAGIGVALTDKDGNVIEEVSRLIGRTTTEVAEYRALIEGCRLARAYSPEVAIFFTDDQDLANHLNGLVEPRKPHVRHLIKSVKGLLNEFPRWRVNYADRAANPRAPRLVERAFHRRIQSEVTRERLELRLIARAASLSEEDMQRLIDHAERLGGRD